MPAEAARTAVEATCARRADAGVELCLRRWVTGPAVADVCRRRAQVCTEHRTRRRRRRSVQRERSRVAAAAAGGLGGPHAAALARTGVAGGVVPQHQLGREPRGVGPVGVRSPPPIVAAAGMGERVPAGRRADRCVWRRGSGRQRRRFSGGRSGRGACPCERVQAEWRAASRRTEAAELGSAAGVVARRDPIGLRVAIRVPQANPATAVTPPAESQGGWGWESVAVVVTL